MKRFSPLTALFSTLCLVACGEPSSTATSESGTAAEFAAMGAEIRMVDGVLKKSVPGFGGIIAEKYLYMNGEKVDEVDMPLMHISTYSLAETFDIGRDTGTQVSTMYDDPFPYDGPLDRVIFTVSDENVVPPRTLGTGTY